MGTQDPGVLSGRRTHMTPRETEVIELLAAGKTRREIASTLCISPKTVETHVANAKAATKAKTTNHLVALFVARRGT